MARAERQIEFVRGLLAQIPSRLAPLLAGCTDSQADAVCATFMKRVCNAIADNRNPFPEGDGDAR